MALTTAQLATLKADILANNDLSTQPNTLDGDFQIAVLYNTQASPAWTIYRGAGSMLSLNSVGDAINATELAGLTTLNVTRLQMLFQMAPQGFNFSLPDRRQAFTDIFSGAGGTNTRTALALAWVRLASRVEKLFSTGTGSVASPATATFEGSISYADVQAARNS